MPCFQQGDLPTLQRMSTSSHDLELQLYLENRNLIHLSAKG